MKNRFTITNLGGGIYCFMEDMDNEFVCSYLVVGSRRNILIDTGLKKGKIKPEVLKISPNETIVINTHTHYDHVGRNREFKDIRNIKNGKIKPGDVIDLGNRKLEIIGTPGHTEDSISLLDDVSGSLFVGDLAYDGEIYAQLNNRILGRSNLEDYIESLDKVIEIDGISEAVASCRGEVEETEAVASCRGEVEEMEAVASCRGEAEEVGAGAGANADLEPGTKPRGEAKKIRIRPGHNGTELSPEKVKRIRKAISWIVEGKDEGRKARWAVFAIRKHEVVGETVLVNRKWRKK